MAEQRDKKMKSTGPTVRWRRIRGDQGLVCVSSALVMSRQDNWNEKQGSPFNEVRLLKKQNESWKRLEAGDRKKADRDNAKSILFEKKKPSSSCFVPCMATHWYWHLSKFWISPHPISPGLFGLANTPLTVQLSERWLTSKDTFALGKAFLIRNTEHERITGSSKMVLHRPQAHFCQNEIREETLLLSQVPPHPSLEITGAVRLIGSHTVLMNNNMM